MDGYAKLKPFGIAIHICIDGYSRQIIWLEAYYSNNNPRIVLGYYLKVVKEKEGCPRKIRADHGTENRNSPVSFAGEGSFIYGQNTTNQRIEA